MRSEPIMKPNIVGNAMIEVMSTSVAPLLIFPGSEVFSQITPSKPNAITSTAKAAVKGGQPKPYDQGPPIIIPGPIIIV